MTATHFARTSGLDATEASGVSLGDLPTPTSLNRRFDSLVAELRSGSDVRETRSPGQTRRPTATRRGPVATPVRPGAERPSLRAAGVPAPGLASPAVRTPVCHGAPVRGHGQRTATQRAATRLTAPQQQAASVAAATPWRLTDRGIAVVMAIGLVLMVAAVVTVVSTAITVTNEDYRPASGVQQRA